MTLIATIQINDHFFVLADTLISGSEKDWPAKLPNTEDLYRIFPRGSGFVPTGMRQKIVLVSENLVVAWSGVYIFALTAINELRSEFSSTKIFTRGMIHGFFQNLDIQIKDNCNFCVLASGTERFFSYSWNCEEVIVSGAEIFVIEGSGKEALKQLLRRPVPYEMALNDLKNEVGTFEHALTKVLAITSTLNFVEHVTGRNLISYFGGAYEIAFHVDSKLQKLKDITYITWMVKVLEDRVEIISTSVLLKNFYFKDFLIVEKILLGRKVDKEGKRLDFYVIIPMLDAELIRADNVKIPPIHSEYTATTFIFTNEVHEERTVRNLVIRSVPTNPPHLSIECSDSGEMGIKFHGIYVIEIMKYIEQFAPGKELKFAF